MSWLLFILFAGQPTLPPPVDSPQQTAASAQCWTTTFVGTTEQVEAFLTGYADPEVRHSDRVVFIGRDRLPDGRERLRYRMPPELPYRDIGGMIFLAQRNGLSVHVEGPESGE